MRSKCGLLVQLARNRLRLSYEPGVPKCWSHKLLAVYANSRMEAQAKMIEAMGLNERTL